MVTKFTLLVEAENSKLKQIASKNLYVAFFRYTEIWSPDGQSKNIKLANPQLHGYSSYPELLLVDVKFCVKA